ncbi:MAG: hypothetical protein ABR505_03310 [Actinomycetota bacterium]
MDWGVGRRRARSALTPLVMVALGALLGGTLVAASIVAQQVATSPVSSPQLEVAQPDSSVANAIVLSVPAPSGPVSGTESPLAPSIPRSRVFRSEPAANLNLLESNGLELIAAPISAARSTLTAALAGGVGSDGASLVRNPATLRSDRTAEVTETDGDKKGGHRKGHVGGEEKGDRSKPARPRDGNGDDDGESRAHNDKPGKAKGGKAKGGKAGAGHGSKARSKGRSRDDENHRGPRHHTKNEAAKSDDHQGDDDDEDDGDDDENGNAKENDDAKEKDND